MNEINLETEKRKLKDRGLILSEKGLFINMPRMFSVPPDEKGFVLEVVVKLPVTFPILSFAARREIERNLKETFTGYYIDVRALSELTRVGSKSRQKTVLGQAVCVEFGYHARSNSVGRSLLAFWIDEAVILEESRRLTTCDRFWAVGAECGPFQVNYVITTINDAETPIYRTDVTKKFKTHDFVCIDVHRHKIYKRKWNESSFSTVEAAVKGKVVRKRNITDRGLQLFGVGFRLPLDKTNSCHFIFGEPDKEESKI